MFHNLTPENPVEKKIYKHSEARRERDASAKRAKRLREKEEEKIASKSESEVVKQKKKRTLDKIKDPSKRSLSADEVADNISVTTTDSSPSSGLDKAKEKDYQEFYILIRIEFSDLKRAKDRDQRVVGYLGLLSRIDKLKNTLFSDIKRYCLYYFSPPFLLSLS